MQQSKYESTDKKRLYVLSTWPKKWGAAAEGALSVSRWLSREEWREEKDWRDLQDSLLDLPPVVKGEPPGVVTDTEKDLSSSNFDLVSSVLDRNASSLPSILSTTSPRLWTWWENTEDIYSILKVSLNIIIRSFFAAYFYTWLNIANSWPIICFQPVAAVLKRLFSTFFVNRDQNVSTINFWHSIQVEWKWIENRNVCYEILGNLLAFTQRKETVQKLDRKRTTRINGLENDKTLSDRPL